MLVVIRLSFVLLVFGCFVHISYLTVKSPTLETTESRGLANLPEVPKKYTDVQQAFVDIDSWAVDRMHYRQQFISALNTARFNLGYSMIGATTVGKEGWLFFNDAHSREHEDARGSTQFTEQELEHWKRYLLYRDAEAKKYGSKFIFLMLPNKSTIYSEYLPDHYTRLSDNTRLQQIVDLMRDADVSVLDARAVLMEGKKHGQVYLKNDTHWNMLGANYAQHLVMQELVKYFPDIKPKLFSFHPANSEERLQLNSPNDLYFQIGMRGLQDTEPQIPVVEGVGSCVGHNHAQNLRKWPLAVGDCSQAVTRTADPEWVNLLENKWGHLTEVHRSYLFHATTNHRGKRSLLMINDSYYEMLQPYFSNQFNHAHYVSLGRPIGMEIWGWFMEALRPNIVIEEMLERELKSAVPRSGLDYPEVL